MPLHQAERWRSHARKCLCDALTAAVHEEFRCHTSACGYDRWSCVSVTPVIHQGIKQQIDTQVHFVGRTGKGGGVWREGAYVRLFYISICPNDLPMLHLVKGKC